MSFFKRGKKIDVGVLNKTLRRLTISKMQMADDLASGEFGDQKFAVSEEPPIEIVWGRKKIWAHLISEEAGGSAILQYGKDSIGNTALDVLFNGWQIAKIVDNAVSTIAWQPPTDSRKIAIAFLAGGAIFFIIGLCF